MVRRTFSYPISLAVVVAALIATTGGFIAWWNYRTGVENVRGLADKLFSQITREAASETEAFLSRAVPAGKTMAALAQHEPPADDRIIVDRCISVLRANPGFKWVTYSDATGQFRGAYREGNAIRVNWSKVTAPGKVTVDEYELAADGTWKSIKHDENATYDPRERPFYKVAKPDGAWTEPYVFEENMPGITYAVAVQRGTETVGVVTIDFHLGGLSELTRTLKFSPNGRVAIVAGDNTLLAHPTAPVVGKQGDKTELVKLDRSSIAAELVRTAPIEGTTWQVIASAPESDFTAAMRGRVTTSLVISAVALLLAVGVAWVLARRVSGPLTALSGEMVKVGNLELDDTGASASMFREIDTMNTSLTHMKSSLRSFARYVPRDLVRLLMSTGHEATLSGETRELTIFFSDLAGFTSLSETRTPAELVHFLAEYFDNMSKLIMSEQGTVDKYMGDGIMAFWNAPLTVENHAARACVATLRCQRRVRELSTKGVELTTRIGLATGPVLVGNIGSTERLNYTVMGDIANLASRLEGLNKQYGTDSMISEETYEQAKGEVVARPVDVVAVKGKQQGVRVYELLALVSDNNADAKAVADASTRALDAYLARDFATAAAAWNEVLSHRPGDKAATIMRDRAESYVKTPPPDDWKGVMRATEK